MTYGAVSRASVPRVQRKSVAFQGGYCHASDSECHDTRKPPCIDPTGIGLLRVQPGPASNQEREQVGAWCFMEEKMTDRVESLPLYRKSARGGSTIPSDLNYRTGWEYEGLTPKKDAKPVAQAIVNRMNRPSILVDLFHRQDCRPCKKRERLF